MKLLLASIFLAVICCTAEAASTGDFIVPPSQQPGPLIGFGETVIGQYQTMLGLYNNVFMGDHTQSTTLNPYMIYGLTDSLALYINLPINADIQYNQDKSAGLGDTFIQLEYAFYARQAADFSAQATVLGGTSFPTGSSTKQPPTGFGSPSFFVGSTYSYAKVNWFAFTASGVLLTTSTDNTQFGNQFWYQFGAGRNLMDLGTSWLIAWLIETDGQYSQKNKIAGVNDPDSGGNVIYLTPSLWFSSKQLIIQPGIGFPIVQHLFGHQNKNNYLLALNLTWSFY